MKTNKLYIIRQRCRDWLVIYESKIWRRNRFRVSKTE